MIMKHLKQRRKMKGGTIFGTPTQMRYLWMYPSASLVNPEKRLMIMARRQNAVKSKRR